VTLPELVLGVMFVGLIAYGLFGGADFGAGIWDLLAGGTRRGARQRGLIEHSIGPVWEANHVWLIFVLVVLWTAFPVFFGSVMSTLYVPMFLAALGIIFRGAAFAFRGHAATIGEARVFGAMFSSASVLVPFCLGAGLGGIAAGRVPLGNAIGDPWSSWINPTGVLVGVLAVVSGAFVSAVYLAADAEDAKLADLVATFRRRALLTGALTGVVAVAAGLPVLHSHAPDLYDGLTSGGGLLCVIGSGLFGLLTMALIWRGRIAHARWTSAAAVTCVVAGWAFAQSPYLLPGELTFHEGAAPDTTLTALLISMAVGLCLLLPSLFLLYRLVLQGQLPQEFQPLDERYDS
jgi:cytochrome d ubiquinol oxidase subunit II